MGCWLFICCFFVVMWKQMVVWCGVMVGVLLFVGTDSLVLANGSVFSQDPNVCIGGDCPNLSPGSGPEGLLDSVKRFIDYALGLLGLLALIIIIWGGFQMVTAAGDEGRYKKGFTILQQAAVGLAFIALSWIIVRFIFFVIGFIVS